MTADLTGTEILGFRLIELIGEGGMGAVWRAEHPTLDTVVAIKVLEPMLARDANLVARFIDEARIQVKLTHPRIVRVENFSTNPLAIIMEYVAGQPLSEIIERHPGTLHIGQCLSIMRGVLEAIGFAHKRDVLHRDVKPSNVLVNAIEDVKVMDFGVAKVLGKRGQTKAGTPVGTAVYMAPEQVKGASEIDLRADIYSIGITFFELLTGRPPFAHDANAESDYAVMEAHVRTPPPDPRSFRPDIPHGVASVLLKALAKEPFGRYQSCEGMLSALEKGAGIRAEDLPTLPPLIVATAVGGDDVARTIPVTETTPDATIADVGLRVAFAELDGNDLQDSEPRFLPPDGRVRFAETDGLDDLDSTAALLPAEEIPATPHADIPSAELPTVREKESFASFFEALPPELAARLPGEDAEKRQHVCASTLIEERASASPVSPDTQPASRQTLSSLVSGFLIGFLIVTVVSVVVVVALLLSRC